MLMNLLVRGWDWEKVLKSEDHKSGSQEPCKKVSQQRARSKPGLGHG